MALAAGGRDSVEVRDMAMAMAATRQMTGYVIWRSVRAGNEVIDRRLRGGFFETGFGMGPPYSYSHGLNANAHHVTRPLSSLNPPPPFSSLCSPGNRQGVSRESYFAL